MLHLLDNYADKIAALNSRRGKVVFLREATLDFAANNFILI